MEDKSTFDKDYKAFKRKTAGSTMIPRMLDAKREKRKAATQKAYDESRKAEYGKPIPKKGPKKLKWNTPEFRAQAKADRAVLTEKNAKRKQVIANNNKAANTKSAGMGGGGPQNLFLTPSERIKGKKY